MTHGDGFFHISLYARGRVRGKVQQSVTKRHPSPYPDSMKTWKAPWHTPAPLQTAPKASRRVTYGTRWDKLARQHIASNPLCQHCGVSPATECHHKVPVRLAPERMHDPSNIMAVCRPCHELLDHPLDRRMRRRKPQRTR